MRLWSVHPRYLDRQALVACWREGLLAQSVLGKTSGGYAHHPQLDRFRAHPEPQAALAVFLSAIVDEATARGYRFDRSKIVGAGGGVDPIPVTRIPVTQIPVTQIPVTSSQLDFEWQHLRSKLEDRSPDRFAAVAAVGHPDPNVAFVEVPGPIEAWERNPH